VSDLLVLHVCTGNICRSPMAERIMRGELDRRFGPAAGTIRVAGAGTSTVHAGDPMQPPAAIVLAELGYDPTGFAATPLRAALVADAGLVLTATRRHRDRVLATDRSAASRTFLLRELARLAGSIDPAHLPPGSPAQRLGALVALAHQARVGTNGAVSPADDIEDPYGEPLAVYRATAAEIRAATTALLGPLWGGS